MFSVKIPELNAHFKIQLEEETIVSELLELIQDKIVLEALKSMQNNINVNQNVKYWTCFSFTQQKILNHQEKLRNQSNQELYVYFHFKENFSEIYASNQQDQKQITSNSSLSTDRQTSKQSELQFQNNKIIFLDGIKQIIEMDCETQVKELLEYLAKANNIDLQKIKNWSCFSESQKRKMNLDEKIGNFPNEIFQIKTNQLQHAQSTKIFNQKQENQQDHILKSKYYQESPDLLFCSKTITLTIAVHDNIYVRNLTAMFLIDSKVEQIAKDVLRFCSLTIDQVSVDIFINDQQFNNPDKRALTLLEANLNRESKIVAKIRWIN